MARVHETPAATARLSLALAASLAVHAAAFASFATHGGLPGGSHPPERASLQPLSVSLGQPAAQPDAAPGPAARRVIGAAGRAGDGGGPLPLTPISAAYPEGALSLGISAKVEVRALVDETGRVEEARVVAATLAGVFDRSALEAVRAARFVPAMEGGRPVKSAYRAVIFYDIK